MQHFCPTVLLQQAELEEWCYLMMGKHIKRAVHYFEGLQGKDDDMDLNEVMALLKQKLLQADAFFEVYKRQQLNIIIDEVNPVGLGSDGSLVQLRTWPTPVDQPTPHHRLPDERKRVKVTVAPVPADFNKTRRALPTFTASQPPQQQQQAAPSTPTRRTASGTPGTPGTPPSPSTPPQQSAATLSTSQGSGRKRKIHSCPH